MAIPTGSGSEVLRNFGINGSGGATSLVDFGGTSGTGSVRTAGNTAGVVAVPANVIITILNIIWKASADITLTATIDWQGSGTDITFCYFRLPDNSAFVFSEKIVLREGDKLELYTTGTADIYGSFIYQDWT
tara:strand:+ start:59 stop:454 length:396 start_codon:yes stop_codon:yes gene_type:complete